MLMFASFIMRPLRSLQMHFFLFNFLSALGPEWIDADNVYYAIGSAFVDQQPIQLHHEVQRMGDVMSLRLRER